MGVSRSRSITTWGIPTDENLPALSPYHKTSRIGSPQGRSLTNAVPVAPSLAPRKAPAPDASALLPDGYAWRRAATQITERLGTFPGDTIAVLAPASHNPMEQLASRMPRMQWLQVVGGPFGAPPEDTLPQVERIHADPLKPPFDEETLDTVVAILACPLLPPRKHTTFVKRWEKTLQPFGRWLSLVAVSSQDDPRLVQTENDLKTAGFIRVRTNRLAGGGGRETLAVMSAKKE